MSLLQTVKLWGENIPWFEGLREKGRIAFEKVGLPTAKTEAWKYSFFKEDDLRNPQIDMTEHHCCEHCEQHSALPFEALKIEYCNGRLHSEELPPLAGLMIKPLVEAIYDKDVQPYLNKSFDLEQFPFAALNTAYLEQGLFILLERGTTLSKPIYICYHHHDNANCLCHIRNVIVLENSADATIIEHFDAEPNAIYTQNIVNEIFIGNNASLRHLTLQNEALAAHHVLLNSVEVKNNGCYRSFCAQKGARCSRQENFIKLLQEGAEAEVNGIYRLVADKQVCDTTTNIRHLAPHTLSNQLVKGVAEKAGRGVFQGQIHIAPNAQQCEGYQLHRALLLDDNAEIDCKPELEIFADDVKCSHGAASGDLDKEQLFYMQTRGIDEQQAIAILITAYIDEVIQKITDDSLKNWIKQNF
ncbi:MAG: Fe-S cluster assembly protein SufD [Alphaproteobacteria bacterium]|nr:Fe-S cluster assembly protein SufD [Alphaproteobacteria bacterium]